MTDYLVRLKNIEKASQNLEGDKRALAVIVIERAREFILKAMNAEEDGGIITEEAENRIENTLRLAIETIFLQHDETT